MQNESRAARATVCALAATAVLAVLAGCGVINGKDPITVSGTAGPVDAGQTSMPTTSTKPATTKPASSEPADTKPASSTGQGCAAGGSAVPAGAGKATTADLDGDGKPDTIWLADVANQRTLGVRTASGANFSTSFSDAAPENATAVAGRLGDGSAVILLDFSRETKLYAVVDCRIVAAKNTQGQQYTFDEGFTGYGTGVGCPVIGSTRHLVGYLAEANPTGNTYTVTRTTISLSNGGAKAVNAGTSTLGSKLPASSQTVKLAQAVTCGTGHTAVEPVS
jgi:hypothetical protein